LESGSVETAARDEHHHHHTHDDLGEVHEDRPRVVRDVYIPGLGWLSWWQCRQISKKVLLGVLKNPPILAIICALLYSLIVTSKRTGGRVYPTVFERFFDWCGSTVTATAGICIGLFMNSPMWPKILRALVPTSLWPYPVSQASWSDTEKRARDDDLARHRLIFYKCLVYLLIKLIALPALCIPIAVFMGLDGLRGQAAVYIASLPVALSSFSLANQ